MGGRPGTQHAFNIRRYCTITFSVYLGSPIVSRDPSKNICFLFNPHWPRSPRISYPFLLTLAFMNDPAVWTLLLSARVCHSWLFFLSSFERLLIGKLSSLIYSEVFALYRYRHFLVSQIGAKGKKHHSSNPLPNLISLVKEKEKCPDLLWLWGGKPCYFWFEPSCH